MECYKADVIAKQVIKLSRAIKESIYFQLWILWYPSVACVWSYCFFCISFDLSMPVVRVTIKLVFCVWRTVCSIDPRLVNLSSSRCWTTSSILPNYWPGCPGLIGIVKWHLKSHRFPSPASSHVLLHPDYFYLHFGNEPYVCLHRRPVGLSVCVRCS